MMQRLAPVSKMACVQKSSKLLYTDSAMRDPANGRHFDWTVAWWDSSSSGHFLGSNREHVMDAEAFGTVLNFCLVMLNSNHPTT